MFSYYGSKSKVVKYYPKPKYKKIIEPFAGSARYSLEHWQNEILLVDKYELIIKLWKWLQLATPKDILSMPTPKAGETINRDDYDCIEMAWLMGFMVQGGVNAPRLTVSEKFVNIDRDKRRIANNLYKIRHWKIECGDYKDISNQDATWFVDPPYQYGGEYYIKGNQQIDFGSLAEWCKERKGHVIVCENTKADWLPFYSMKKLSGTIHTTTEAIWSNQPHDFMARQDMMF